MKSPPAATQTPKPLPWLAMFLVWIGYVLLGWQLSAYDVAWEIGAWLAALIMIVICIWGGEKIFRLLRLGPRSIGNMLFLSTAVTLAAIASSLFAMVIIILGAEVLTRLEMAANGWHRWPILWTLISLATLGLTGGWLSGVYLIPSSPFWLASL
jgi:cation transport ATPase